ncbi:MAG: hypothetical protein RR585_06935 [Coprobacillus sp.]
MKKWKKYLLYGVIVFLFIGVIGAIFGEEQDVKAISIQDSQLALDVNKEKTIEVAVEPSNVKLSKSDFVVEDESLVEIDSIKDNIITLKTLKNEGSTTLYCLRNDIKSNEVTVKIVDEEKLALAKAEEAQKEAAKKAEEEKKLAEAKKIEDEKKAAEAKKIEDAKKAADAKKAQQAQTTKKSTSNNSSSSSTTKPTGQKVYITPTGKKYHAIAKCGNTKSSTLVSLGEAQSRGLGACSKCY